jgi:signal transduction histidine kinase
MISFTDFKDFISHHKDYIIQEMRQRLGALPRSFHRDFILRTKDGQRRLDIWVDLTIKALEGDREPFLKDQDRVGYARATQGTEFEDAFCFYYIFQQIVYEVLKQTVNLKKMNSWNLYEDLHEFHEILLQGYSKIAASYLKTREERVFEKVTHLQELYNFTNEIIATFELEEIAKIILTKMIPLFGAEKDYLAVYRGDQIQGIYSYPAEQEPCQILALMESSWKENVALFVDEKGDVFKEVDLFHLKRIVTVPICSHGHDYGALALVDNKRGFNFTSKELALLYQFVHVAAIAFENVFMLEEIQQRREELHLLTSKMITIQEEERKHLAGDIHDTIAQTLAGISYKMQFCKELARRNSELLIDQLDDLINTVNEATDQSRELISNLRPDLLDTIGLVPALSRFLDNYSKETGIRVSAQLPELVQIIPDIRICLFRIAQEALKNVYKHANTYVAEVILKEKDGNIILIISDQGKGFDMAQGPPGTKNQNKLGLLSMKERVEAAGGTLLIDSRIHGGCRIEAKIPLKSSGDPDG